MEASGNLFLHLFISISRIMIVLYLFWYFTTTALSLFYKSSLSVCIYLILIFPYFISFHFINFLVSFYSSFSLPFFVSSFFFPFLVSLPFVYLSISLCFSSYLTYSFEKLHYNPFILSVRFFCLHDKSLISLHTFL